jgi:type IV secretory pathway VirB10-like protein
VPDPVRNVTIAVTMMHSALLVAGGAVLTCLLAALVFSPQGSPEERRMREERRLLRALEAQHRIRDAQRRRQAVRTVPLVRMPVPEPEPPQPEPEEDSPSAEPPARARREEARRRRQEEKAREASLRSQQKAEERSRKVARKAEQAQLRRAEEQRKREEKEKLKAALEALPEPVAPAFDRHEPEMPRRSDRQETPLAELPLFSWTTRMETEDQAPTESG